MCSVILSSRAARMHAFFKWAPLAVFVFYVLCLPPQSNLCAASESRAILEDVGDITWRHVDREKNGPAVAVKSATEIAHVLYSLIQELIEGLSYHNPFDVVSEVDAHDALIELSRRLRLARSKRLSRGYFCNGICWSARLLGPRTNWYFDRETLLWEAHQVWDLQEGGAVFTGLVLPAWNGHQMPPRRITKTMLCLAQHVNTDGDDALYGSEDGGFPGRHRRGVSILHTPRVMFWRLLPAALSRAFGAVRWSGNFPSADLSFWESRSERLKDVLDLVLEGGEEEEEVLQEFDMDPAERGGVYLLTKLMLQMREKIELEEWENVRRWSQYTSSPVYPPTGPSVRCDEEWEEQMMRDQVPR